MPVLATTIPGHPGRYHTPAGAWRPAGASGNCQQCPEHPSLLQEFRRSFVAIVTIWCFGMSRHSQPDQPRRRTSPPLQGPSRMPTQTHSAERAPPGWPPTTPVFPSDHWDFPSGQKHHEERFCRQLGTKNGSGAHKFGVLSRVDAPSTARHDTAPAAAERAPAYSVRCSRLPGHRARFSMGGGVNLQTTYSLVMLHGTNTHPP